VLRRVLLILSVVGLVGSAGLWTATEFLGVSNFIGRHVLVGKRGILVAGEPLLSRSSDFPGLAPADARLSWIMAQQRMIDLVKSRHDAWWPARGSTGFAGFWYLTYWVPACGAGALLIAILCVGPRPDRSKWIRRRTIAVWCARVLAFVSYPLVFQAVASGLEFMFWP
jgi:hypothetical protein